MSGAKKLTRAYGSRDSIGWGVAYLKTPDREETMSLRKRACVLILVLMFPPFSAWATNGMNMIGYGAVSSGMGGADLAVVDNASAMNINPAGICSCTGPQLGAGVSVLMPKVHHQDAGNDLDAKDEIFPLPLLTYATPVEGTSLTFGIGAFAQGGMGVDYDGKVLTPGGPDDLFSNVSYLKVTPTVAWQSADSRLKLGASLNIGRVGNEIRFFPGAANGFSVKDLTAFGYGARLGFQYRIDDLVLAGAWLSKTSLDFKDGDLTMGGATYEAKMEGFDWPQQAGLGLAYHFGYAFRVAVDVDWVEWSQAVDEVVLRGGPADIVFPMKWEDQWVYAIGAEWEFRDGWLARLGYNHGDSPVPDATLSALFPAILEDHVTIGLGYRARTWQLDLAYEHAFEAEQTNSNSDPLVDPFAGSTQSHEQNTTHLMMTWFF